MTHKKEQDAKFHAELTAQTTAFAKAIEEAIHTAAKRFDTPMINAVAGAIMMTEANLVVSAPEGAPRIALVNAMNAIGQVAYENATPLMDIEMISRRNDEVLQ